MSLKYKILTASGDTNIIIPLNLEFDPMDNSEIIEELIRKEKRKSVNINKDLEKVRYSPILFPKPIQFRINFYDCDTETFYLDYKYIGFNTDGTSNDDRLKKVFSNSFYVMDFYDSMDSRTQTKLFSTIIPTIPINQNIDRISIISRFLINPGDEGYFLYYLKDIDFPKDIFMKLTFFNAKTGKRISFFNPVKSGSGKVNANDYKDEFLYFKFIFNKNNTYEIIDAVQSTFQSKPVSRLTIIEVVIDNN